MEIMIVEDDRISRRLLEKMVADLGHSCVIADNGREAWDKYQQNPVQVVITPPACSTSGISPPTS